MFLGGRIDADAFGANWITWLLGDLAGGVIVFPLLVAVAKRRWTPITVARFLELLLLFGLQVVLSFSGLPLGILSNSQFPCSAPLQLHSGDVVVMLTDGVLEAFSPDRVQFGKDRTVQFVREHRDQPAAQIIEALREAVDEYTERAKLTDDLTFVVIKVE